MLAADTSGRITFLNPIAEALTGWRSEEALGQPLQSVFPIINEQTRVPAENIVTKVLKEGHVVEMANHTALLARDGREIPVEDSAAPILDGDGKVIGVVLVFHDVTEKRRAQQEIFETQQRLKALLEALPVGINFSNDPTCQRISGNPAALAQFDAGPEDNISASAPEDIAPLRQVKFFRRGRQISASELPVQRAVAENCTIPPYELEVQLPSGRRWFAEASGAPVRDQQGNVVGGVAVTVDITERKRAEEALLRSEKLASVGRMAATIAHEINNPLEAVMSVLFLAKGSKELSESTRQYLEIADGELNRIAHITRQSLGFYRESNAPALTSVNAVLESAVDLLKSRIKAKHAVIEKEWEGDVQVTGVAGELRQVFSNLLANSLDAIDTTGTIKLRVSTGVAFNNGHRCVRVTVADNGKGIAAGSRQHIFEPFFTTKGTVGTGLGLWVSKQIVDKHGGTIRMRSSTNEARRGTAFSIVLPISAAAAAPSQSAGA